MRRREFIAIAGAAAWPLVAQAQRRAVPVIGYMNAGTDEAIRSLTAAVVVHRNHGSFPEVIAANCSATSECNVRSLWLAHQ